MPELPEVENVKSFLKQNLKDNIIKKVIKVDKNNIINEQDINILENKKILDIKRIAKFLIFILNDNLVLISHLRMEGRYYILDKNENIDIDKDYILKNFKYVHVIFELENKYLLYIDKRKFGRFELKEKDTYLNEKPLSEIALEPFNIDIKKLYEKLKKSNKTIKSNLLNQKIISGLGNIYADEVLFKAKILPFKKSNTLTYEDVENIVNASIKILNKAIKEKGTTIYSFEVSQGLIGNYQNFLKVHTRENQTCFSCINKIIKTKVDKRGTYYCGYCQK